MIEVDSLTKTYKVLEGKRGFAGAVQNLFSKDYRYIEAVKGISFRIDPGEVVGFIGPNGAGKSTTIKMLTGILVPTGGRALVRGIEPYRHRQMNARQVGVVFGQRTKLWWDLPCLESFELHRDMYQIPKDVYQRNIDEFTSLLGLADFWKMPVRQLSLGQRMRAELAISFLHNPEVIYLDEPTIGMDATGKERIRQFLTAINRERGTTLMITSHDMNDIEKLCPRVMIIDKGIIIYDGMLEQIKEKFGGSRTLMVEFAKQYEQIDLPWGKVVKDEGIKKHVRFLKKEGSAMELIEWLAKRYEINDVSIREPEIEVIIREIYEKGVDKAIDTA